MLLETPVLASRSHLRHGFTTRAGGVSEGSLASLNLALRGGESSERLEENWRRVAGSLSPALDASAVAVLHQVHGAGVVEVVEPGGPLAVVATADAAWTRSPGVVLGVRVADCVPILVGGARGCAVIHAGWRGAAAGVVPATLAAYCEGTGERPADLVAAIGPCISAVRFEVGPEVVEALAATGVAPQLFSFAGLRGKPHVDLVKFVSLQLQRLGLGTVESLGACTVDDPRFYSHRREGDGTGRSAGVIVCLPV